MSIKVVILCGGVGSRLAEDTKLIPKPMVKIGNLPILSHIIKIYKHYGFNEFILATGYKSSIIENCSVDDKMKYLLLGLFAFSCIGEIDARQPSETALPVGWTTNTPRTEIAPEFAYIAKGGSNGQGSLTISAGNQEGLFGWFEKTFEILDTARKRRNKIFIIGNGGSACTASHVCNDFGILYPFPTLLRGCKHGHTGRDLRSV